MRALGDLLELLAISGGMGTLNDCREKNGTLIFRVSSFIGGAGLVGVLSMLAVFISAIADSSQLESKLILGAMIGLLSLPLFLSYIVSKVYIDNEKITLRNPLGIKKSILWDDLKVVYTASNMGDIRVCSEKKEILIYSYFKGSYLIEALIDKFCPESFRLSSLLGSAVIPRSYRKKNGALVFRTNKVIAGVGVLFLLFALFIIIYPLNYSMTDKLAISAFFGVPGLILFLYSFVRRVCIDPGRIEYRNMVGLKKDICWADVEDRGTFKNNDIVYFKVCSREKTIKISKTFSGYELIKEIIFHYCPAKHSSKKVKRKKQENR